MYPSLWTVQNKHKCFFCQNRGLKPSVLYGFVLRSPLLSALQCPLSGTGLRLHVLQAKSEYAIETGLLQSTEHPQILYPIIKMTKQH